MSKVSIYVVHYNKPELLQLQYENLIKYCKDNFIYNVINNGINNEVVHRISELSKQYSLNEIRTPNIEEDKRAYGSSTDHIKAVDFIYKTLLSKDKNEIRIIMDSDIIPYKLFSFQDIIKDYQIAGIDLGGYLSSFIILFRNDVDLTEFDIMKGFQGGDSGMATSVFMNKYKIRKIPHTCPLKSLETAYIFKNSESDIPCKNNYAVQFIDKFFIHYYRGTNWDGSSTNDKWEFFVNFISHPEEYNILLDDKVCYESAHIDEWVRKDKYKLLHD